MDGSEINSTSVTATARGVPLLDLNNTPEIQAEADSRIDNEVSIIDWMMVIPTNYIDLPTGCS